MDPAPPRAGRGSPSPPRTGIGSGDPFPVAPRARIVTAACHQELPTSIRLAALRAPTDTLFFDVVLDVLVDDPAVRFVGLAQTFEQLAGWRAEIDVAVVAADVCGPVEIERLLRPAGARSVIALHPRDGHAVVHELRPCRVAIGEVSVDELRGVVHGRLPARARAELP